MEGLRRMIPGLAGLGSLATLAGMLFKSIFMPEIREELRRRKARRKREKAAREAKERQARIDAHKLAELEARAARRRAELQAELDRRVAETNERRRLWWETTRPSAEELDENPYD